MANVLRAQLRGQEFLYSPVGGGALTYLGGLPMEFDIGQEAFQPDPPGYNEGKSGDPFLKIGVGILRRDGGAYNFSANYPVVELARTTATWQPDRAHFVQTLTGNANGYCCHLEEDVIVKNDRLIMNYLLRNTGSKPFTTEQYLHDFVCFSAGRSDRMCDCPSPTISRPIPPSRPGSHPGGSEASWPRRPRCTSASRTASNSWTRRPAFPRSGSTSRKATPDPSSAPWSTPRRSSASCIETSIPAAYVGIWTTDYQVSPEQFLQVTLAPGEETRFTPHLHLPHRRLRPPGRHGGQHRGR